MARLGVVGLLLIYMDLDTAGRLVLIPQIALIASIRRLHVGHEVRRADKEPIADG